jgi:hypothetical protein
MLTIAVVFAACNGAFFDGGPPVDVNRSDIKSVGIYPYPEGVSLPPFTRKPGAVFRLESILDKIPTPLPAPVYQGFRCEQGNYFIGVLIIALNDGRSVEYGPCRRPGELDPLVQAIHEAWDSAPAN